MNPADEHAAKHARLIEALHAADLEGALLTRRCNVSWYTCGTVRNFVATAEDAGNSTVLVNADGAAILTNNIEAARLRAEEAPALDLEIVEYPWPDAEARAAALETAIGGRRVAADVPVAGVQAAPWPTELDRLRWTLTEGEIERYRDVATDTVDAVEAVARAVEPGETEHAMAGRLAGALRAKGLLPWVLLVAADERVERFRHPLPTDAAARRYVMLVTCAERGGLIAACTRLAAFEPVPPALAEKHRAVATVDAALISATRPGETFGKIFDVGRAAYEKVGHPDEWRQHHQGGSIGYLPREAKAGPGEATQVLASQAFAWNPSIAGTKSEDTVLVEAAATVPLAPVTDWPTVTGEWEDVRIERAAILERSS